MRWKENAKQVLRWAMMGVTELRSPRDLLAYARCERQRGSDGEPVALRVRDLGREPALCRPGTTDALTLWDTCYHRFHLPPVPLRNDAILLDLGANVGYTMLHLAHRLPLARVFAVEMDAANARMAERHAANLGGRARVLRAAVWDEDRPVRYEGDRADGFHVVGDSAGQESVQGLSMESILKHFGLESVDYLKMDIEGAEEMVLARPQPWMQRVGVLNVELHPPARYDHSARVLEAAGFTCRPHPTHPWGLVAVRGGDWGRGGGTFQTKAGLKASRPA